MKIPQLMIEELNTTMDFLEEAHKSRRQLVDTLLEILDERDTIIDDLTSEINRLTCQNKVLMDLQNIKRAD